MKRNALLLGAATIIAVVSGAAAAGSVRVSLSGSRPALTVGRAWTAKLAVRPASFNGVVRVAATGPKRIGVRATGGHGAYRARLVFPAAGRWTLTAHAGGSTSRLGAVQVRKAPATPLVFVWPTSVDVEPSGSLIVVENGLRRLVRVNPTTGRVTKLAALTKPFAVRRAPSGSIFVSDGPVLRRIDGTSAPVKVAGAESDIGPIAIAPNGDVYYTTETKLWKLAAGNGTPLLIGVGSRLSTPHGLAVAADGAVLVADTGNHRILRVDGATGAATTFAELDNPRGMDIAADGTVYVVDANAHRVVHLSAAGGRLGFASPTFNDPYDLALAPGGVIYVVDSQQSGNIRRVAADGTATTVSRP